MTSSPNLCVREEQWRLQLLCIHWQPDRWNNPHTTLCYQPAPRITWQQTGRLWEVSRRMRNSAVAAPYGLRLDSSAPTFPPAPSLAVIQLINFTTVLHRLHACYCILRCVWELIWLKTNMEKGHWCERRGERRSAQPSSISWGGMCVVAWTLLKATWQQAALLLCEKPSPVPAHVDGADFPIHLLTFKVEGECHFHSRICNYSLISW